MILPGDKEGFMVGLTFPLNRIEQNTVVQKILFNLAAALKPSCFNGEIPDMLFKLGLLIPGPEHAYDVDDSLSKLVKKKTGIVSIYEIIGEIENEHLDLNYCTELVVLVNRYFIKKN